MTDLELSTEERTLALMHARAEVERLREREHLFAGLLASVNAVLWAMDWRTRGYVYVSPAYESIFGRAIALVMADSSQWANSIHPDDLEQADYQLHQAVRDGAAESREYRIVRGDGEVRWISDKCFVAQRAPSGEVEMLVGIAEDITEKKSLEGELQRLATTDVLTRSSNRRYFFERAQEAFLQARLAGQSLAFLLMDIDDFKKINDTHGHQAGDVVLQRVAEASEQVLRRGDLFGRIGGEEFAAVLPGCDAELAEQIGGRLHRAVGQLLFNFPASEEPLRVTISQGVTIVRDDDLNLNVLYVRADEAMYRAKRQGKNQLVHG